MIKKGTALPIKKVIGAGVGLAGAGMVFNISQITQVLQSNQMILGFLLLVSSYFLIKSGSQL